MKKRDVTCPVCKAGFRRLELSSAKGRKGEYRCPACNQVLETFDGDKLVEYRLTVQPLRKDERLGRHSPHPKAPILDPTSRRRVRLFGPTA
jgi:tRNA(Ile2) C34 agmatinyltransferase TiaS